MKPVFEALTAARTLANKCANMDVLTMLDAAETWLEQYRSAHSPTMDDLMVSPESLDAWLKDNPPPETCVVNAAEYDALKKQAADRLDEIARLRARLTAVEQVNRELVQEMVRRDNQSPAV